MEAKKAINVITVHVEKWKWQQNKAINEITAHVGKRKMAAKQTMN